MADNSNTDEMQSMFVVKRNGTKEEVSFDKVLRRIKLLSKNLSVNPTLVAQKINARIYDGVKTAELDELGAEICAHMTTIHPDYGILATRIIISNHHKNTSPSFSEVIKTLWDFRDKSDEHCPLINKKFYRLVMNNKAKLNSVIKYDRDFDITYFGFKTLERAYLLRTNGQIQERQQHLLMRVALGIHGNDIKSAIRSYDLMSQGYFTHATPTLFNMGTNRQQGSSCFLLTMQSDSICGIYDTLKQCALISKNAGGIGVNISIIRAMGALIRGTNGTSNGIVPMLRVFNNTARYVDQGGSKRNGSFAMYIEPWHADIEDYLMLKRNTGFEEIRARDLFYALWIPDLFMQRVKDNAEWTLMCPDECQGLNDVYGKEFEELYTKYERENKGRKTIKARELWFTIIDSQIETGTPYMLYKDACNIKSNQKNIGVIRSSNLCAEIVEHTSKDEVAVCNLASIALPKFVDIKNKSFDFKKLEEVTKVVIENLNKVIDVNYYPVVEAKNSNMRHRPVGAGVQGLADVFALLKIPFDSPEAKELNKRIFEHIYYASLECSMELSKARQEPMLEYKKLLEKKKAKTEPFTTEDKSRFKVLKDKLIPTNDELYRIVPDEESESIHNTNNPTKTNNTNKQNSVRLDDTNSSNPKNKKFRSKSQSKSNSSLVSTSDKYIGAYSTFAGSPASQGILQYDLWGTEPSPNMKPRFDALKKEIQKYGLRNSLLLAMMPTASTSQILGNNECIEPYTSNIYKRRVLSGEFKIINQHLLNDLIERDLWTPDLKDKIILNDGSVQGIPEIPQDIQRIYKTVWEMDQKTLIEMSADRGAFVCQTQSLNLFVAEPSYQNMTALHFAGWRAGLKTGMYYLRSLSTAKAQQFTIDPSKANGQGQNKVQKKSAICDKSDPTCEACSG